MSRDPVGQRSETVRRANLSALLRELHASGPLSRSEFVARTGLTRSAIRGLIGEFAAADFVGEERADPLGAPGRPSPVVRLKPQRAFVIALEIAVDSLAAARVGLGGKVLELRRVDRSRRHFAPDEIVADLVRLAAGLRQDRPAAGDLIGIGVAVVGVARRSDGFVSTAPNLGWHNVPLGDRLRATLGFGVRIAVGNEADLGALAEARRGAARGSDDVLFVSGEVGVGGGIIVNGNPMTGVAGYGGEVGHIAVNPEGRPCRCGSIGCWETEVGEGALLLRAGHPVDGGRVAVEAVLREAAAGSSGTLEAMEAMGHWLGIGLASLVNVLNPRLIVLGGLFGRIHPFVQRRLEAELDRRALPASRELVRVVPATLGVDAPLLGAAELAFEPLLADPSRWLRPRDMPVLASA
jgi:predicted NBD/HSP70 family sugar kinase